MKTMNIIAHVITNTVTVDAGDHGIIIVPVVILITLGMMAALLSLARAENRSKY